MNSVVPMVENVFWKVFNKYRVPNIKYHNCIKCRSVFILSNTPIITTDSRCDGYEDCFDQSDEVGCEEIEIGASNNTVEDDYDTNDLYENEYTTWVQHKLPGSQSMILTCNC